MPVDTRIQKFASEVENVLAYLHKEYSQLQTGRASASLVEHVLVDAYGQKQELRAVAGVSIQDARTIIIQPWDKAILGAVESALGQLDVGNPVNDGNVLRISLPPMTEERRKDLVKIVHQLAEEARISIRQQRQDVSDSIKKETDEDVKFTLLEELDKSVKDANDKIEETKKQKEAEVMKV